MQLLMLDFSKILQYFVPQPSPYPLVRIGGSSDGAYLVPKDFDGITACFSPGVCNTKDFEDDLAEQYNIRSYMCDFSSDEDLFTTPLIEGLQTFEKKWLDLANTPKSHTLDEWVDRTESGDEGDLILQMDIEGAEYRNLLSTPKSCLKRFRIIVLEIHSLGNFEQKIAVTAGIKKRLKFLGSKAWLPIRKGIASLPSNRVSEKIVNRIGHALEPYLIEKFAKKVCETHICVHAHPNNCCGEFVDKKTGMNVPRVLELTFLRKDRFQGVASENIPPIIPHPLDIVNVPNNPPLALNSRWHSPNS